MVTVRKSAPKSREGCRTCKIRHVKCDEGQPSCQRCMSTGRSCDGYGIKSDPASPADRSLFINPIATRTRSSSTSNEVQERRSFEFFRNETVPSIAGFFGSPTWNLVLQACNEEPAVAQAAIALGAIHESLAASRNFDGSRTIETSFPIRQYARALGELRRYLSTIKGLNLHIVLLSAFICISVEVIQNNYINALVHLENSLHLLQTPTNSSKSPSSDAPAGDHLPKYDVDTDLNHAFLRLDLHASTFQGMRPPSMTDNQIETSIPGRFYSLGQAKDILDRITGHLYFFCRSIAEEYKYRKQESIPIEAMAEVALIKNKFDIWNDRFEKYLNRSTSRFSRQEQLVVDAVLISHRLNSIEAATCTQPEATIFDQFDTEFDEIVTMAANVIRSRKHPETLDFQLDIGIIHPLYLTAIRCREPWIRQRAMSLLRSIKFQEGVWNATIQAAIAQVAIDRENSFEDPAVPGARPLEFARVHSVGSVIDPVKRVAEVNLTQKLGGLDGPWHVQTEWCSW